MGTKWEDYKKEKLENNPDLKREYEKLKSKSRIIEVIEANRKEKMISKKKLAEKSGIKKKKLLKFEKGDIDMSVNEFIQVSDALDLRIEIKSNEEQINSNKEKFVFVDGENFTITSEGMPIKDEYYYYIYLNKITDKNFMPDIKYIKELETKSNVTIKYINDRAKNLMDILIEMDISYLFHNYKKRAEIAIISSDRGFDNYIKNFNILTGDNLILRRINRTSNIYEKLEENAEDCINTEKSAELTIERLKGNMPNLPKDLKSLKNIIANVAYAEKKKIDAEKVINYLEENNQILIESSNEVENAKVFYRLH
jgi:transcriptional regulator with XRE-family HTH domain